jgi:hypothetical protein
MTKPISSRVHGMVDYATGAALLALPNLLGWHGGAATLARTMGLGTLAYSALTDYELGLQKLVPFPAHLALDGLSAATFLAAPLLLGERSSVRGVLLGIGLFELAATLLSEPRAYTERALAGESVVGRAPIGRALSSVRAGK